MSRCRTIAIANQKGGVGKTTTTFSLGVALANAGKKVLVVDADPQANLTTYMGYFDEDNIPVTLSTLIEGYIAGKEIKAEDAVLKNDEGLFLIPSHINLAVTAENLSNAMRREDAMKECFKELKAQYDYIIIDCAPSLNMITTNALTVADEVIIPVQSQYLSAVGMGNLLESIAQVRRKLNKDLQVGGVLQTMVDKRTKLPTTIKNIIEKSYGDIVKIYDTQIPFAVKTAESTSKGQSIFAYDKKSKVAEAYSFFAEEVLKDSERKRRRNALAKGECR